MLRHLVDPLLGSSSDRIWERLKSFSKKTEEPAFEFEQEKRENKDRLRSDGTWEGEDEDLKTNFTELKKTVRLGLILALVCAVYIILSSRSSSDGLVESSEEYWQKEENKRE